MLWAVQALNGIATVLPPSDGLDGLDTEDMLTFFKCFCIEPLILAGNLTAHGMRERNFAKLPMSGIKEGFAHAKLVKLWLSVIEFPLKLSKVYTSMRVIGREGDPVEKPAILYTNQYLKTYKLGPVDTVFQRLFYVADLWIAYTNFMKFVLYYAEDPNKQPASCNTVASCLRAVADLYRGLRCLDQEWQFSTSDEYNLHGLVSYSLHISNTVMGVSTLFAGIVGLVETYLTSKAQNHPLIRQCQLANSCYIVLMSIFQCCCWLPYKQEKLRRAQGFKN